MTPLEQAVSEMNTLSAVLAHTLHDRRGDGWAITLGSVSFPAHRTITATRVMFWARLSIPQNLDYDGFIYLTLRGDPICCQARTFEFDGEIDINWGFSVFSGERIINE